MKLTAAVVSIDPSDSEIQHAAYLLLMDSVRSEAHNFEIRLAAKEKLSHEHAPHAQSCRRAPEFPTSQPATSQRLKLDRSPS